METFQELREIAKKKISLADHLLNITYPFVKDQKMLITIVDNIFLAVASSMSSVLHYERLFKRIPLFPEKNFEIKFSLFKTKCAKKYNIPSEHTELVREIKDIVAQHRKSPVEFSRNGRFVICNGHYRMKIIGVDQLKKYIENAKAFIGVNNNIVNKNSEIFKENGRAVI